MIEFALRRLPDGSEAVTTRLRGFLLLETPILNKGAAFTEDERRDLGLIGLLPHHVADIDEQLERIYANFHAKPNDLEKHIYLRALQDRNEVLYYRFLLEHIEEMAPLVYTPTVGAACQRFSHIYRRARGLFMSYPHRDQFEAMLEHRMAHEIDVIVVTDGERILGLGDQGVGGMGISIGKLSLYSLCGGIHPARTLPIVADLGTDNADRLADPHYLGWRHHRIRGDRYFEFFDRFVAAVAKVAPRALVQWEDFAGSNAGAILDRYRDRICSFNDDIQGTAAVATATVLSAARAAGRSLCEERIVIVGGGSAGCGIAEQLAETMVGAGISRKEAESRIWVVDRDGLVLNTDVVTAGQARFAKSRDDLGQHGSRRLDLATVVTMVNPTTLIGVSGQPGIFTEPIVRGMASQVERPAILPLSNPTSKSEATPADLMHWTEGRALIATGSPFGPTYRNGRSVRIAQCNNSYVFPGLGLGVIACRAIRITDGMFAAATACLADLARSSTDGALLPPFTSIRDISRSIAIEVGIAAIGDAVADTLSREELEGRVDATMWYPRYPMILAG